ncbi:MAG: response regulator [Anaerolineales bacterium]
MITAPYCSFFLVEDNVADAELVMRALKKAEKSVQVYLARDGEQALQMLNNWPGTFPNPLVILLDLKLPKIDGLELLKSIKTDEKLKAFPVIVLTSSNQTQDIQKAYQNGANSYVTKAIDFDEFSRNIETIQKYWCKLNVFPY